MAKINDAINWWENELTGEQRSHFMSNDNLWSGEIAERHARLLSFYDRRSEVA